jgi:predicted HicB family RNase H-like nuclease
MSVLSVRLPESLHQMAKHVAEEDKVSLEAVN